MLPFKQKWLSIDWFGVCERNAEASIRPTTINRFIILCIKFLLRKIKFLLVKKIKFLLNKIKLFTPRYVLYEQVVDPILFLLSDRSGMVNGTHLPIEGGKVDIVMLKPLVLYVVVHVNARNIIVSHSLLVTTQLYFFSLLVTTHSLFFFTCCHNQWIQCSRNLVFLIRFRTRVPVWIIGNSEISACTQCVSNCRWWQPVYTNNGSITINNTLGSTWIHHA